MTVEQADEMRWKLAAYQKLEFQKREIAAAKEQTLKNFLQILFNKFYMTDEIVTKFSTSPSLKIALESLEVMFNEIEQEIEQEMNNI